MKESKGKPKKAKSPKHNASNPSLKPPPSPSSPRKP
jgi:hypothetical protein